MQAAQAQTRPLQPTPHGNPPHFCRCNQQLLQLRPESSTDARLRKLEERQDFSETALAALQMQVEEGLRRCSTCLPQGDGEAREAREAGELAQHRSGNRYCRFNCSQQQSLMATVPCLQPPMANWHNDLNMTRPKVVHPQPGSMLGANQVPPAVPLMLSPVPAASCMLTPRVPPSGPPMQRPPAVQTALKPDMGNASDVPPLPTRPVVGITSATMEDRNDPHFWQTQLDTSFSVASTVSRTPLSPSPVKVESSYVPRVAAATSPAAVSTRASVPPPSTTATSCLSARAPATLPPTSLGSLGKTIQMSETRHDGTSQVKATELLKTKLSRLMMNDMVVDPYEGLRLTPINEQPFQAIASIARQAQQSLVDRFLSR